MTHICVSDLTSIGSDNGLSPGRRQAIIRTNAGILLIRPLGTNFSEFSVEILIFSFKKMRLKVSSAKRRPFCLGLNELTPTQHRDVYLNGEVSLVEESRIARTEFYSSMASCEAMVPQPYYHHDAIQAPWPFWVWAQRIRGAPLIAEPIPRLGREAGKGNTIVSVIVYYPHWFSLQL